MSKRRRLNEQAKEEEVGLPSFRQRSPFERLPSDLSQLLEEFGEYDPGQLRVSKRWWAEATRHCEARTKAGEACLRKDELAASCVRYCTSPAPCAAWLTRLLTAMERVASVRIGDRELPVVEDTAHVIISSGSAGVGEHWNNLLLQDGRWVTEKFQRFPRGSIKSNEALGPGHFTIQLSPAERVWVEERDPWREEDEDAIPVLDSERLWRMDAANAARMMCHIASVQTSHLLHVSFRLERDTVDWSESRVSFFDSQGRPLVVADPEQEWKLGHGGVLTAYVSLRDRHALWCEEVTKQGDACLVPDNRVHRGCADYCLADAGACQRWIGRLLDSLGRAVGLRGQVAVAGDPTKTATVLFRGASVDLLDSENGARLQLRYLRDQWSVAANAPGVGAWRERMLLLHPAEHELPEVAGQVVLKTNNARYPYRAAAHLLCHVLRDPSVTTLRAEMTFVPDTKRRDGQAEALEGSRVVFPSDRFGRPVDFRHEWEVAPGVLTVSIRLRPNEL